MEENFHSPDAFRYSANAFIRALKEIPQILKMELQNHPQYRSSIKATIDQLYSDPLFSLLSRKRDFIVHHGVLQLHSSGFVGTTEGAGSRSVHRFQSARKKAATKPTAGFGSYAAEIGTFVHCSAPIATPVLASNGHGGFLSCQITICWGFASMRGRLRARLCRRLSSFLAARLCTSPCPVAMIRRTSA